MQRNDFERKHRRYAILLLAVISVSITTVGCKPKSEEERLGAVSGLYTVGVQHGQALPTQDAYQALQEFCSKEGQASYLQKIAKQLSFYAGYKDADSQAGYDAPITQTFGPDGKAGYFLGQGQSYQEEGVRQGMMPGRGNMNDLLSTLCDSIMVSLGASQSGTNPFGSCAHKNIKVSRGGSVSGKAARGEIDTTNCLTVDLSDPERRQTAAAAFCPSALATHIENEGYGAAGLTSMLLFAP